MSKEFRSILDELDNFPSKDEHLVLEARAHHAIISAINVLRMMNECLTKEEAEDLSKRFLLAIKNQNIKKFDKGMQVIKERKDT